MRSRISRLSWSALLFGILACARQQSGGAPQVVVAESREAQVDLRDLREQWALSTNAGRKQLRPDLENFLERHAEDPTTAEVRVMLAQVALSERRYGAVREILRPVFSGEGGMVADEAELVLASLDNAEGKHASALSRLGPLKGKMLSESAREKWYREHVIAALAERRWRLAIASIGDWLSQSGIQSREVRTWVVGVLVEVPVPALARLLADGKNDQEGSLSKEQTAARDWLQRQIVEHVARVAIERQDAKLARDLLTSAPPWLRATSHGDRLLVLSARAAREARVSGRLLGVVVGGKSAQARRRSIRVAAGAAELLGAEGIDGEVRLLPVEDRGSTGAALGTLSGLGAAVLIAGVDAEGASEALRFAAEKRVPVISLHPPETQLESPFGFVLGVSQAEQLEAVGACFPEVKEWVTLSTAAECRSGFGLNATAGLFIVGQEPCLRQVSEWSAGHAGPLVVGLAASKGAFLAERSFHVLQSEHFPGASWSQGAQPAERPPDWFFVLGRDAARLARAALLTLPSSSVEEQRRVEERHLQVAQALRRVHVELDSSSAGGFGERGRIEHPLRVHSPPRDPVAPFPSSGHEKR